jgi:putative ABC transport system permease protein
MDAWWHDVRFASRMLVKNPALTVAIVLILTVVIGVNTAILSVVKSLLFDSPHRNPDQLVFVAESVPEGEGAALSCPDLRDYERDQRVFSGMAGFRLQSLNLTGESEPERLDALQVEAGLFDILGVRPILGRTFTAEEDRPGGAPVVALSEGLWRRRFGASPDALKRQIRLDEQLYTVVGVMPASFQIWRRADLFLPLGQPGPWTNRRDWHCIYAVGRLRPDVSLQQARSGMRLLAERLNVEYPDRRAGRSISLRPLRDQAAGEISGVLWLLACFSGVVLALGCLNVAGLLHSRGFERAREISIRLALGAGRASLVRLMAMEAVLLGILSAGTSLLVAWWCVRLSADLVSRFVSTAVVPTLDWTALALSGAISLAASLASALVPAWWVTRVNTTQELRSGGPGASFPGRERAHRSFVVAQVTLSALTLVVASLTLHSLIRVLTVPLGVEEKGVVLADISLPASRYPDSTSAWRFCREVLDEAGNMPGVESAAMMTTAPMSFIPWNLAYQVEHEAAKPAGQASECDFAAVSSDYFKTLGIRVLQGRVFKDRDDSRALRVAVIDRMLAEKHFPGEGAVGKRLSFPAFGGRWIEIVGVVDSVRNWGPEGESQVQIYVPLLQSPSSYLTLAVKTDGQAAAISPALRQAVRRVDRDLPLSHVRTMESVIAECVLARRVSTSLLAGFAAIALALACAGLYGTLSRAVARRFREIGVRLALGATCAGIAWLIVGQGVRLVLLGLAIGLGVSLAVAPLVSSLLFETNPREPLSFLVAPAVLLSTAVVTCLIPARRAAGIDPIQALRE